MGTLFLVPTPVGNMEDITARALRILREADLILAEDTRTSGNLLRNFDIQRPMMSYHKFNEHQAVAPLVERLKGGETMAVVTDAGTPGISDPGFLLAREAIQQGVEVITLPGAITSKPSFTSTYPGEQRSALRQVRVRGFPAAEEGATDPAAGAEGRAAHPHLL